MWHSHAPAPPPLWVVWKQTPGPDDGSSLFHAGLISRVASSCSSHFPDIGSPGLSSDLFSVTFCISGFLGVIFSSFRGISSSLSARPFCHCLSSLRMSGVWNVLFCGLLHFLRFALSLSLHWFLILKLMVFQSPGAWCAPLYGPSSASLRPVVGLPPWGPSISFLSLAIVWVCSTVGQAALLPHCSFWDFVSCRPHHCTCPIPRLPLGGSCSSERPYHRTLFYNSVYF